MTTSPKVKRRNPFRLHRCCRRHESGTTYWESYKLHSGSGNLDKPRYYRRAIAFPLWILMHGMPFRAFSTRVWAVSFFLVVQVVENLLARKNCFQLTLPLFIHLRTCRDGTRHPRKHNHTNWKYSRQKFDFEVTCLVLSKLRRRVLMALSVSSLFCHFIFGIHGIGSSFQTRWISVYYQMKQTAVCLSFSSHTLTKAHLKNVGFHLTFSRHGRECRLPLLIWLNENA